MVVSVRVARGFVTTLVTAAAEISGGAAVVDKGVSVTPGGSCGGAPVSGLGCSDTSITRLAGIFA